MMIRSAPTSRYSALALSLAIVCLQPASSALAQDLASDESTPLKEAEVRKLVTIWQETQNGGRFADYQTLYATKMIGIRRSGPRVVNLGREGWMADRGRMFKKPMTVEIADLRITLRGTLANVRFTQTWSSGSYKDTGVKELQIIRQASALRIAREEMLSSSVDATEKGKTETAPLPLSFVHDRGVVLSQGVEPGWERGKASWSEPKEGGFSAIKEVNLAALPQKYSGMKDRSMRIYSLSGPVCTAKIAGFSLVSWAIPHFGMVQEWDGQDGGKPWSKSKRATETWNLGDKLLVGTFTEKCKGGVFALPESAKAPIFGSVAKADAALAQRAFKEVRKLPAYGKIAKDYASTKELEQKREKAWEDYGEASKTVQVARVSGTTLVITTLFAGPQACSADFSARLQVIWELKGDAKTGTLVLRNDPGADAPHEIGAAADIDGDGTVELFTAPKGILRLKRAAGSESGLYEQEGKLEIPSFDCPC